MSQDSVQLPMNFDCAVRNRFRERLDNARFNLLIETDPPAADADLESVLERNDWLNSVVSDDEKLPCALAFTEPDPVRKTMGICEYATALVPQDRDRHLLYLSGRGRTPETMAGIMSHARLEGFRNAVFVSGYPAVENGKRLSDHTESISSLRINGGCPPEQQFFSGCAVNPFKYEISASMTQYFKLIKKIGCGASFAAVQTGWDLRKLQELRWYLFKRGITIPLIARTLFLSPERADSICRGREPSIRISADFADLLRDEMKYSRAQFEAGQWRRLQLQAAGARLIGYSSIQIGGLDRRDLAVTAASVIRSALQEFPGIGEWLDAYNEYFSRVDMTPYPEDFYLYKSLLQKQASGETAAVNESEPVELTGLEKFRWNLASVLLRNIDAEPADCRKVTKKILASCPGCAKCRLDACMFVCPETCFCGFANGVCGEVAGNGTCPYNGRPCSQLKRFRIAVDKCDFRVLEETVIE